MPIVPAMQLVTCTPNHLHMSCAANKCSCLNGLPKTGAACTKDGALMCSTCKAGFTINAVQTKCLGV